MHSSATHGKNRIGILPVLLLLAVVPGAYAQQPTPTFTKAFTPNTIGDGSVATLRFDITNSSGASVTNLAFTDILPVGMNMATPAIPSSTCGGTLTAPDGGGMITFTGGSVGASTSCTLTVDVTAGAEATYTNTSGDLTSSAGNSGPATADLDVTFLRPGFSKSFSPNPISFNSRSTLTFTIDNSINEGDVFRLAFTDNLPSGMVIANPANAATTCNASILTAVPGSSTFTLTPDFLSPNPALDANNTCTVSVDVIGTTTGLLHNASGELTSRISLNGADQSSGKANATLEVVASPVTLIKTFTDDPVRPDETVTLEFTVTNFDRTFSATAIAFTDDLDAALSGLAATGLPMNDVCGAGSQISGTSLLTLTGGSLAAEGSCTFSVTLQVPGGAAPGTYPNTTSAVTATVDGAGVTGNAATDNLFVTAAPAFTKTFLSNPVGAGSTVTLEFFIANNSTASGASGITFTDNLDAFISGTQVISLPANGFCGAGSSLTAPLIGGERALLMANGNLQSADSGPSVSTCTFSVNLQLPAGVPSGPYMNTTSNITATVSGMTAVGNPATDILNVVDAPTLTKAFTDDPTPAGGTVILEFTIAHDAAAPTDATDIAFTDDLDAVLSGLAATGLPMNDVCGAGSQINGTSLLTLTGGTLAPGASCTFSVTLQVPVGTLAGTYTNTTSDITATVDGAAATRGPAQDNLLVAGLMLTKSFTDDPASPNGTVTLEFTIDNTQAADDATNMTFTDDLNAVLSGLAATGLPMNDVCGAGSQINGTSLLTFTGGNLLAGTSCTFSVTLQVPGTATTNFYINTTSNLQADVNGSPVSLDPATDNLEIVEDTPPGFLKTFVPDQINGGATSTLTFTIDNTPNANDATGLDFTDNLPAGVTVAGTPNASTTCTGGTLTAVAGTGVVSYTGGTVTAGASCTVSVDVTSSTPGTHTNVTGDLTSSLGNSGAATDDLEVVDLADIVATKVDTLLDADAVPQPGDTLRYTIELTNISTRIASAVVFTDTPDANTTLRVGSVTTSQGTVTTGNTGGDTSVAVAVGDIAASSVVTITFEVIIAPSFPTATTMVCNQGNASGSNFNTTLTGDPDETGPGDPDDATCTSVVAMPDLVLGKDDGLTSAVPGQALTYTLTYQNAGDREATGVEITETVSAHTTSGTNAGWEVGSVGSGTACDSQAPGTVCVYDVGTLAGGAGASVDFAVVINNPVGSGVIEIVNTASILDDGAGGPDPTPGDNTASDTTAIDAMATVNGTLDDALVVDTNNDGHVDPGDTVRYTAVISNNGQQDASNVVFKDVPDANTTLVVGSVTTTQGTVVTGNTGGDTTVEVDLTTISGQPLTLAAQAQATVTFDVTVNIPLPAGTIQVETQGTIDFDDGGGPQQTLTDDPATPALLDPTVTPIHILADVELTKTASMTAPDFKGAFTFEVVVTNNGPSGPTQVTVKDLIPSGLTILSTETSDGTYKQETGEWAFVSLGPGERDTLRIEVQVNTISPITNTAEVIAASLPDPDSEPGDGTGDDYATVTITPVAADLSVDKSIIGFSGDPGASGLGDDTISATYLILITNNGPSTATGVVVHDPVPEGASVEGTTASQGAYDAGTGLWTVGTLANQGTATLTVTLTAGADNNLLNVAEVTGDQPDQQPNNNLSGARAQHDLEGSEQLTADLSLEKTVDDDSPEAGQVITYTLRIANGGPSTTAGVKVLDLLPDGLEFVDATAPGQASSCSGCGYNDSTKVWVVGSVYADSSATLQIMARVTGTGTITNTAQVIASNLPDLDSSLGNGDPDEDDQASATITVQTAQGQPIQDAPTAYEQDTSVPTVFELGSNYPNPFNPETVIPFAVPETAHVTLTVYDLLGRIVAELLDRTLSAGRHTVTWEATNHPTGIYIVRLQSGSTVKTRRVTLLK